ncbi:glycolate oxidase subunit GlcD [Rhodomicrobium udaipurense JA643]|uniref:FAD-binding protein n=1 Tax=Rhodomicrobium udaipurense TaxID=1202716 RepID=A0A8I1GAY4_9HYPH|nr:FAD-linked oxidase C-terminal domain-containing protein [Rhodomicrobium udaipurense]KAI96196.1 glycolate oxidase subunit GlcD [Rhodomicrobium udaipurense JA643]MBJ7543737.1 FAD-binding protein [Rhodomicrobium udaipurense]
MSVIMPKEDLRTLSRRQAIISGLSAAVGSGALISDEAGLRAFETDALTAYRQPPLAVVLPRSTSEVVSIARFCSENCVKLVARGAGTSLSGGAIPTGDAIVIGLSRMNRVLDVNFLDRTATVEAGITNLAISNAVAHARFFYAPDPSSQLACTIGGNIAMNSGGAHCLKYGVTTNNLLKLKMVLMDGEVVELGGDFLDGQGYDFLGLATGSEGQFGIVTEATVRILPQSEGARPMLIGFDSAEAAGNCVAAIIADGLIPVALEFMDKPAIRVCEEFAKADYPLDVEAMLIVEVEGSPAEIEDQIGRVGEIASRFNPKTLRVSQSDAQSAAIWKGRKAAFGAVGRVADYLCMDGVIPLGKLAEVLKEVEAIGNGHGLRVANIFHAGDGNLHPMIMYNANDEHEKVIAEQCGSDILKLCVDAGGCLTGEHGVGIEKRELMRYQYSEAELLQQMRVKAAFDPQWLLNYGKVFPLDLQERFAAEARAHA